MTQQERIRGPCSRGQRTGARNWIWRTPSHSATKSSAARRGGRHRGRGGEHGEGKQQGRQGGECGEEKRARVAEHGRSFRRGTGGGLVGRREAASHPLPILSNRATAVKYRPRKKRWPL